ncbi:tyrosine-type recombinase/integrase [Rubrivirga sp.]|uniref:tyrosine-type recombinase/integrase n=1 Tax=Rubrivirga sp. TaxID=1885344 RepID=UPI003C76D2CD
MDPFASRLPTRGRSTRLDSTEAGYPRAVDLFVSRTRHTRSGSVHTERAYRTDLRHFGAFLEARVLEFDAVTRRDAGLYLSRLAADHAARTVRRRVSCVRSFYRFLRSIELVAANPFDALDLPDVDRKSETHKVLSDDELSRLVGLLTADAADARCDLEDAPRRRRTRAFARLFTAERRRAALTLMAFAGLRRGEVVGLTRDALVAQPEGFSLAFTGKGGKTRTVPLVGFVEPALVGWLDVRRRVPSSSPTVLVTLAGRALAPKQLRRDCAALGQRAGTRVPLTPHVLRRTFATRSLRASGDIRSVQELLGHASINTTEVYTHVDQEGLRALVESIALPTVPAPAP